MSFFNQLWDNTAGGLLWKPLKKATGLTDAQMIGLGAMAVAAPYALPAMGASGAAGAGQAAGASSTGGLFGFSGGQAAAPIVDLSTTAAPGSVGQVQAGLFDTALGYGKTALGGLKEYGPSGAQAVDAAYKAKSMTQGQPMQAPPAQFQQGQGFAGLLSPTDQVDMEKRRQAQQMAVQGLLGGYRG